MAIDLTVSYPSEGYRELFEMKPSAQVKDGVIQRLPSKIETQRDSMKTCIGMINMARAGFMLFCPWTFTVTFKDGQWSADKAEDYKPPVQPQITFHPKDQHTGYMQGYQIMKLALGMTARDKSGTNYFFGSPSLHNTQYGGDVQIIQGISDFKYIEDINVFIAMKEVEGAKYQFNTGDCLMQLIPMTDKKVNLRSRVGARDYYSISSFFPRNQKNPYQHIKTFMKKVNA